MQLFVVAADSGLIHHRIDKWSVSIFDECVP